MLFWAVLKGSVHLAWWSIGWEILTVPSWLHICSCEARLWRCGDLETVTLCINCLCVAFSCQLEPGGRTRCNYPMKEFSSNSLLTLSGIVFFTNLSSLFRIKMFVAMKIHEEGSKSYLFQCPPHPYKTHREIILSIYRMENVVFWMEQVDWACSCYTFRQPEDNLNFWFFFFGLFFLFSL